MSKMNTVFLPEEYTLTITADAVSSGHIVVISPGVQASDFTTIAVSTTTVLGPFSEPRQYNLVSDKGEITGVIASASSSTLTDLTASVTELNIMDGVTATTAELNLVDNIAADIDVAYAASVTTDGIEATYTVQDAAGATIEAVHFLEVTITDVVTGIGVTGTAASGALTIVEGTQLEEVVAKKHLRCQTDATGVLKLKLIDDANTTDEYFCVKNPVNGKVKVGPATVVTDYEGGV